MLKANGDSFEGKTVVDLRLRQRGHLRHARRPQQLGAKVVAMSDSTGWIYDPDGIDLDAGQGDQGGRARPHQRVRRTYRPDAEYHEGCRASGASRATSPCPAPPRTSCCIDDAKQLVANGCHSSWPRAPTCPPPSRPPTYLQENGVLFGPGKAANAGGVATSALEMSQNSDAPLLDASRKWTQKLQRHHGEHLPQRRRRGRGVRPRRATTSWAPTSPASRRSPTR